MTVKKKRRERILVSTKGGGFRKVTRDSKEHRAIQCAGKHTFDGPDDPDKCLHCGTRRGKPLMFARLAYIKWWEDSMRDLWRAIGVEMCREPARFLARAMLDDETIVPDHRDPAIATMLVASLVDHKLQHPRARGERLWVYVHPPDAHRSRADVTCRFCHAVLLKEVRMGENYGTDPRVREHTVACALTSLATGRAAPPIKRQKQGERT